MTSENTETLNKALLLAVENNNLELIQWIFTQGKPTNVTEALKLATEKNFQAIMNALTVEANKKTEVVHPPYGKGLSMDMIKSSGEMQDNSHLMMMISNDPVRAYQELIDGKFTLEHINHQNQRGWTALHYLGRNYQKISNAKDLIKKLVELGADINLQTKACGQSIIVMACYFAMNVEIVKFLLDQPGVDLEMMDHGAPVYHHLCRRLYVKQPEMVRQILAKVYIDLQDENGSTLFEKMCVYPTTTSIKLIEILLSTGLVTLSLKRQFKILAKMTDEKRDVVLDLIKKYKKGYYDI